MEYQKPEYSMTFDDPGEVVGGAEGSANELTKKVLRSLSPAPQIGDIPDSYIKLPAGWIHDGEVIRDAEVRELNGEHEELLAKARTSNNAAKYVQVLLQSGVVSIGNTPCTTEMLDSLVQGDLDALIIGVRRATFGESFELFNVPCDSCGEFMDLEMQLKDIPMKELENPEVRAFSVPLRKGRTAKVQFPTGAVQNEIYKKPLSVPEMNSITLSHCVISFTDAKGNETPCNGLADVKKLGVMDREAISNFLFNNQPGPRYDQVVAKCLACEGEVSVPLNVGVLFREL